MSEEIRIKKSWEPYSIGFYIEEESLQIEIDVELSNLFFWLRIQEQYHQLRDLDSHNFYLCGTGEDVSFEAERSYII